MSNQTTYRHRPLTKKAKRAIEAYVNVQAERRGTFLQVAAEATLKADRMKRKDLYDYLQRRGYRWRGDLWRRAR